MSCVSCEMSGNTWDELCELWDEWSSVRWVVWVVRWFMWKNLGEVQWENTKQLHQMPHESSSWESWVVWDQLSEMSCVRWVVWLVRWEELCELWHERSCVRRVLWVVRWVELCEMSCVSCGMSCLSCEMSCVKELGWRFSARTRKQLHQMPHESSSWVSWVVWDELWEMSCVR